MERRRIHVKCTVLVLFLMTSIFGVIESIYAMQVGFLVGDVHIVRNGKRESPSMGYALQKNDVVRTGQRSMVEVKFEDGSVIKVQENSQVKMVTVYGGEQDSFSVVKGVVQARFSKLTKGATRKLYTPTTVCAIRGTEFQVAVSDGVDSRINMQEGSVVLHNQYGKSTVKGKEQAGIPVAGKPEMDTRKQDIKEWKKSSDGDFSENPEKGAEKLKKHVAMMKKRADKNSETISKMEETLPAEDDANDQKDDREIKSVISTGAMVEDDMHMNQAATGAVEHILGNYEDKKNEIYETFLKIKKESNRVLEQQQKNYQGIQAVKKAYKEAYGDIMDSHSEYMDSIKDTIDRDSVKPKLEK